MPGHMLIRLAADRKQEICKSVRAERYGFTGGSMRTPTDFSASI